MIVLDTNTLSEALKPSPSEFVLRWLAAQKPSTVFITTIVTGRGAAGRPISQFDAMIAAIARSRGAAVATRNTNDFEYCGIRVINPWTE